MQEIWKDIKGFEGSYQVSNLGNIRSLTRKVNTFYGVRTVKGKILKPLKTNTNYFRVDLKQNQKHNYLSIHKLVAETFIPNPNNYPVINHKDNNPLNNCLDNLEWCTQSYNVQYAYKNGNAKPTTGCFKKGNIPHNRKKVNQYSKDGKFLRTFISIKEAASSVDTVPSNINQCLSGSTKTAKGYIWRYANE